MSFEDRLIQKLRERSQSLLEPGETIERIIPADGGVRSPMFAPVMGAFLGLLSAPLLPFLARPRAIALTDRSILIIKRAWWNGTRPTAIAQRLPRGTTISRGRGMVMTRVVIGGNKLYVHRRRSNDLDFIEEAH